MIKINLVPEVQEKKLKTRRRNAISVFIAVGIVVLTVLSGIVIAATSMIKEASLKSTNTKIAGVKEELEQYKELEETVLSLEKGLNGIKSILDGENNLLEVLAHLEKATPSEVSFKNLKIKDNAIEAELEGRGVDGLAKFVSSLENYQLVVLSGTAEPGKEITVMVDDQAATLKTKSNGSWKKAISFDPTKEHSITITGGETTNTSKYDPKTKNLSFSNEGINAEVRKLFNRVDSTQYQKENNIVKFNAKINFEGTVLW